MDKTAWIVVTLCTIGLVLLFQKSAKEASEAQEFAAEQAEIARMAEAEENQAAGDAEDPDVEEAEVPAAPVIPDNITQLPASELVLENDEAKYQFSQVGGGVQHVTLKSHRAFPEGQVVLNQNGKAPIGALTGRDALMATPIVYEPTAAVDGKIVFTGLNPDTRIQITKTYSQTDDPYTLDLVVKLENKSGVNHSSSDYYVHTGAIEHIHHKELPIYLSYSWCEDGEADKEAINWFNGGGFIFKDPPQSVLEANGKALQWAGPINQFYASLIVPDETRPGSTWARRSPVTLADAPDEPEGTYHSLYGAMSFPEIMLADGESSSHKFKIFTGPRELKRMEALGHNMKQVMHYDDMPVFGGMFGIIPLLATTLLKLMIWLAGIFGNWGVAILIVTAIIRICIWPLHAKSTATMKRMSKLAPMMTELKEKHADDPQKMQQETMKLYRDYGINPLGGCLPVFLQLPIFLSFYKMLQSAVELRDQHFLWVKDLAMPDAIYNFENFSLLGVSSLNLMPLLMAITMIIQMKVGPKAGDKMQQRIFMFMPLIFLFICYNFASALALYWTGQNIFSIAQTWLMNRRPEPELVKRPAKKRMSLQDMQKARASGNKPEKKTKKRKPRTGG
ncbi:MAG: membrane protein insertase YidC [Verrucomicrobiaceae bacterium]|nr:membrane protein insertase YidC [Verrucomicrobiaceae bacterium]